MDKINEIFLKETGFDIEELGEEKNIFINDDLIEESEKFKEDFEEGFILSIENGFDSDEIVVDSLMEKARGKNIFLAININCIDPAFAPGVIEGDAFGMSRKEFYYLIKRLSYLKNIRKILIYGIDFEKDEKHDFITTKTVANAVRLLLG